MTLWHMVRKEISQRKATFVICLLAVIIATATLVSQFTALKIDGTRTDHILTEKEKRIEDEMKLMEDNYQRIMKEHGFSLLILPEGQNLDDFYDEGYSSEVMPETCVDMMAESNLAMINHLLPTLEQKIRWPEEYNRTILLIGIGELSSTKNDATKPRSLVEVAPGKIVLGYELWNSLNLEVGDNVELLGENFEVGKSHPRRGTVDDITAWIDLEQAQDLLGLRGKISGIRLLQCLCEGYNPPEFKRTLEETLPGTQVILLENRALTRWESRSSAKTTAKFSFAAEQEHRSKIRSEMESFASWMIPLVFITSIALIGMLTLGNVRERRPEIAILRTLGYRSHQILYLFLTKALILGIVGAILGYIIGFVGVAAIDPAAGITSLFDARILVITLIAAPAMSLLASWVPAMIAASQNPADILKER